MDRNSVVLVDESDNVVGEMPKLAAHEKGCLHRAFSVFIFNDKGELLLQQRASHKYHGADLWTNTCCSHPQLGEGVLLSALERLAFEMGLVCELEPVYTFIYNEAVENGLIEHELDHVFVGYTNDNPVINTEEVKAYKWVNVDDLMTDLNRNPTNYTVWFRQALPELMRKIYV